VEKCTSVTDPATRSSLVLANHLFFLLSGECLWAS